MKTRNNIIAKVLSGESRAANLKVVNDWVTELPRVLEGFKEGIFTALTRPVSSSRHVLTKLWFSLTTTGKEGRSARTGCLFY